MLGFVLASDISLKILHPSSHQDFLGKKNGGQAVPYRTGREARYLSVSTE